MLLFIDGFDAMTAIADADLKWTSRDLNWTYESTAGVNGGGAVKCLSDDRALIKRFRPDGVTDERTIRFAGWFKSSTPPPATDTIATLEDTVQGIHTHYLRVTTSGLLGISKADEGSIAVIYGTASVCDDGWHHIEVHITSNSANGVADGTIQLWVNGVIEVNLTNITTGNTANNQQTRFNELILFTPDSDGMWDDVIIWDDNAGDNFTGELPATNKTPTIDVVYPDAAGSNADFAAVGAASNHLAVDETGLHDGATTYVHAETPGDKDLYQFGALDAGATEVLLAAVTAVVQSDAGANVDVKVKCKSGTTEVAGATKTIVSDGWRALQFAIGQDPDTSLQWTKAGVDGAEFGLEIA